MRPPRGPVQAHVRARVLDLHAKGLGRNEIAKLTGIGAASVTRIVQAEGGSFDRSKTEQAVKARVTDMANYRTSVAEKLLVAADELLDKLHQPFLAYNIGGKDNVYTEHEMDGPSTPAIRDLVSSAATALKAHTELVKFDQDPNQGLSAVDDWLSSMMPAPSVVDTPSDTPTVSESSGRDLEAGNAP